MKKIFASVLLTSLAIATLAWAQTVVTANQGQPGKQGPWPVTINGLFFPDGGGIPTYAAQCVQTRETVSSTIDGGAWDCPTTQLTNRRWITMCNSQENSGTVGIKIRFDRVAPAAGLTTAGEVLNVGDCITLALDGGVTPICIDTSSGSASTAQQALTTLECAF